MTRDVRDGLVMRDLDFAPPQVQVGRLRVIVGKVVGVQGIHHEAAVLFVLNEARLAEYAEVVGDVHDFHAEELCQFGHIL